MIHAKNMIAIENVFNVWIIIFFFKKTINVSKFAKILKKVFYFNY